MPWNTAEHAERTPVGVKQHLVRLKRIGTNNKGTANDPHHLSTMRMLVGAAPATAEINSFL